MQVTSTSLELVCIFFKMIFVQDDFYSKTGSYLNEKKRRGLHSLHESALSVLSDVIHASKNIAHPYMTSNL